MPLTNVVDYFNVRLLALHPHALLGQGASYLLHRGLLTAQVAGLILTPNPIPVHTATGELFGRRARFLVRDAAGHPARPESLHVQAWNAEDMVFLDCFLRTFHALNHLHHGHDKRESLVLDVHLRHLAARPEHQGGDCEALLHLLGLGPHQIVLRLDAPTLHVDSHLQATARKFTGRGYRLLAARPNLRNTDWDLLSALGVRWVAPHIRDLVAWQRDGNAGPARNGIALWLDGVDSLEDLAHARVLGAELIEPGLQLRATRQVTPRPVRTPTLAELSG
ncbi:hypothetical protein [uncultured Thiodictyon sp.]|uniref:hypothetical protein n=1 Tax=uncultured Thiodictyon sp. TaxID=1846217 RepID=UPI0025DD7DD5|nr:hypothetical protein [uncultured Thiodictyon sp.]